MSDIVCPLCGKPNPDDRDECLYCQAPLKSAGFITPTEPKAGEGDLPPPRENTANEKKQPDQPGTPSPLEQAIPDWLRKTEASFLDHSDAEAEEPTSQEISEQIEALLNLSADSPGEKSPAVDDDWLTSLLSETGLKEPSETTPHKGIEELPVEASTAVESGPDAEEPAEEQPASPTEVQKPDWLSELEAGSQLQMEEEPPPSSPADQGIEANALSDEALREVMNIPEWVSNPESKESTPAEEDEPPIVPAELPGWLEALRPKEAPQPTGPVEDLSAADVVTAGPLAGLRGVISPHSSAIRPRKPPTYSIKLRVTDEQRARVQMMEELLAEEQKPKPLPTAHIFTSRRISRLVIALVLILPILIMIITRSQRMLTPQPGMTPGVTDFIQQVQQLPADAPVLLSFDYEAGFSGEMNLAISTVLSQLMTKNTFLALVSTNPSGPALAESFFISQRADRASLNYANLGYIPGGSMGLLGVATSIKESLPYPLDGSDVWASTPMDKISGINDFSAVIVIADDPGTARLWIEQVGPVLQDAGKPLLIITSSQAEPLIRPYSEAVPAQVQGVISGLAGGLAYAQTVEGTQQNGVWDALSVGITISVLIIVIGGLIGVILMIPAFGKKES